MPPRFPITRRARDVPVPRLRLVLDSRCRIWRFGSGEPAPVALPVPDRHEPRLSAKHGNEQPELSLRERQLLIVRLRDKRAHGKGLAWLVCFLRERLEQVCGGPDAGAAEVQPRRGS
jgi:hypothetical protein